MKQKRQRKYPHIFSPQKNPKKKKKKKKKTITAAASLLEDSGGKNRSMGLRHVPVSTAEGSHLLISLYLCFWFTGFFPFHFHFQKNFFCLSFLFYIFFFAMKT